MARYKLDKAKADSELAAIRTAAADLRDVVKASDCFNNGTVKELPTGGRYYEQHLQLASLMQAVADLLESDVELMQSIFDEQERHDKVEGHIIVS